MIKHGTLLAMISTHSLAIQCRDCGHSAKFPVQDLIGRLGHGAAVRDVIAKIRCRKCTGSSQFDIHLDAVVHQ